MSSPSPATVGPADPNTNTVSAPPLQQSPGATAVSSFDHLREDDDPAAKRGPPFAPSAATMPLTFALVVSVTCMVATLHSTALHSADLVDAAVFDAPLKALGGRIGDLQGQLQQLRRGLDASGNESLAVFDDAGNAPPTVADKSGAGGTNGAVKTLAAFSARLVSDLDIMSTVVSQAKAELFKLAETKNGVPRVQAGGAYMGGGGGVAADPYQDEYPTEAVDPTPGGPWKRPADEWSLDGLSADEENVKRRESVVEAFKDSYKAYIKYAWGYDELQPRSKQGKNWNDDPVNNMALSVVDALATMHLMGLHDWVDQAVEHVTTKLNFDADTSISAFETNIRVVGSLLSIYELRGEKEPELLKKAVEIGNRILWAYNTTTGIPQQTVNLATHHHNNPDWSGGTSILSEFGTVQLEMRTLSYHTKNPIYDMKATHVTSVIEARAPKDMLCPVFMSCTTGKWMTDHITLGALGDSFYEYLLKQWLLTGKTENRYKNLYKTVARSVVDKLLFKSKKSKFAYIAEWKRGEFYHKMDELACFAGGMLALGAEAFDDDPAEKARMLEAADGITTTCYQMFHRQKSGIAPEYVEFPGGQDFINGQGYYLLRPETMESIYYMWRTTKDPKWREYGWDIFAAIKKHCKTKESGGYAGIKEVNVKEPIRDNLQQSFWLAETLKYSYLLFSDDDALDLKQWVFNTEAHPLKIRTRDPLDVWREFEEEHGHVPWLPPRLDGVVPTETDKMRKKRLSNEDKAWRQKSQKDGNGEEMDGMPDDDAGPFDPKRGMDGVRRGNKNIDFHAGAPAAPNDHPAVAQPETPKPTPRPRPEEAKPVEQKIRQISQRKQLSARERAEALERARRSKNQPDAPAAGGGPAHTPDPDE